MTTTPTQQIDSALPDYTNNHCHELGITSTHLKSPMSSFTFSTPPNRSQPRMSICANPRRTSADSINSTYSTAMSSTTATTNDSAYSSFSNASFYSPSYSPSPLEKSGWLPDEKFSSEIGHTMLSSISVWKPTRPAPPPLPQHEPSRTGLKIHETPTSFDISIHLPGFARDSVTVAQRREDHSIYIVADQLTGANSGHFERLISLSGQTQGSAPSKEVTSQFDSSTNILSVRVIKLDSSRNRQRAVVCDNGSGLTGNKTYRLFL